MNDKEAAIIEYLYNHNKKAWYIDIRQELAVYKRIFDSEYDFDKCLNGLAKRNKIVMDDTTMVFLIKTN
ncbi:MAG: hypothetical protein WCT46_02935 [Candidatus Gracilibacteria bacterium]|jgi:hypothetical protein